MLGKQKCKILKEIRQKIADENDIPFVTRECTHKGECKGTCPRCESELRYLEQQLQLRQSLGKRVAVAALCTGLAFGSAGCSPIDGLQDLFGRSGGGQLSGDVAYVSPSPEVDVTEGMVPYDEPLEGETSLEPEPEPGVNDGGEEDEWELMGEVAFEPEPEPADGGNG